MGKINVVGLGPGNTDYLTGAGIKKIREGDILIGGERQLDEIKCFINDSQKLFPLKKLEEMKEFVINNIEENTITFIVSGDTGYYSLLTYLKKSFPDNDFDVVPGISSFQYLFGKIEDTWENFSLHSVHGRDLDIIDALEKSYRGIVLLTDKDNNPYEIGKTLYENYISHCDIIIGERLSYDDEKITICDIEDYEDLNREFKMNVTIIRKR